MTAEEELYSNLTASLKVAVRSKGFSGSANALPEIARQLGLPQNQLQATPYKLLLYKEGGFFLSHRDSEKQDRMVATLVIVLPNPFLGGELKIVHGNTILTHSLEFLPEDREDLEAMSSSEDAPLSEQMLTRYVAFYADCDHEVLPVEMGVRMSLEYTLTLKSTDASQPEIVNESDHCGQLAKLLTAWTARKPDEPLVFAPEHQYTAGGLKLDLLKGTDRALADSIVPAAQASGCDVHLARLSRCVINSVEADDETGADADDDANNVDVGEEISTQWSGGNWTDLAGVRKEFGKLKFDSSAVISLKDLDTWQPESSKSVPWLGNQGAGVEKWYHRSALTVWKRERSLNILVENGFPNCVPLFCQMVSEHNNAECLRFARLMLEARQPWDDCIDYLPVELHNEQRQRLERFRDGLYALHDLSLAQLFLRTEVSALIRTSLKGFVRDVGREFGFTEFADTLKLMLVPNEERDNLIDPPVNLQGTTGTAVAIQRKKRKPRRQAGLLFFAKRRAASAAGRLQLVRSQAKRVVGIGT